MGKLAVARNIAGELFSIINYTFKNVLHIPINHSLLSDTVIIKYNTNIIRVKI